MLHKPANPVVVLGRGAISVPLKVRVQRVSENRQRENRSRRRYL
jgi:hypothetical protein